MPQIVDIFFILSKASFGEIVQIPVEILQTADVNSRNINYKMLL